MLDLHPRNHSQRNGFLGSRGFRILEIPRAVWIGRHIQYRFLKHDRFDDYLPMQKRSDAKFCIDPRHLHDITGREYRGILHAEMIDMNRHGEKCECQPSDFNLLSSLLLEIRDNPRPVAVYVNENR